MRNHNGQFLQFQAYDWVLCFMCFILHFFL